MLHVIGHLNSEVSQKHASSVLGTIEATKIPVKLITSVTFLGLILKLVFG